MTNHINIKSSDDHFDIRNGLFDAMVGIVHTRMARRCCSGVWRAVLCRYSQVWGSRIADKTKKWAIKTYRITVLTTEIDPAGSIWV